MAVTEDGEDSGTTLFRDFLRHFPRARLEDYYKEGRWLTEQLEVDLALVAQHRREAGSPDPVPLEEIPVPELPRSQRRSGGGGQAPAWSGDRRSPERGGAASKPIGGRADAGGRRPKPKPPSAPPSASAKAAQRPPDMPQLNDFISRWRLDPVRAKTLIARLPASRRRFVLDDFHYSEARDGGTSTSAFERFVADMLPAGGTKRTPPAGPSPADSSKRPRPANSSPTAIGAAPGGAPPARSAPPPSSSTMSSGRSPPATRGGGSAAAAPWARDSSSSASAAPWRDAGAPPPRSRPAPPSQPKKPAQAGGGPTRTTAKGAPSSGGSRPAPAPAPSKKTSSIGAAEDFTPGDLIKNLLG